jgi:hypothetical protein
MNEYRWAIAFIAILFLTLALADLHNSHIGTACRNAEEQVVACADLQQPRVSPASERESSPAGALPRAWHHAEAALHATAPGLETGSTGN